MKRNLTFIALVAIALFIGGWFLLKPGQTDHDIHYHVGFKVFKDGQPVDFSGSQYMVANECRLYETKLSPQEIQIAKVHLHDSIGDVAHIHQDKVLWQDLFQNLNYPIESSYSAYLDRQPINDFLDQPIKPYSSLVVITGTGQSSPAAYLDQAVTLEHIAEAEAQTESCN